MAAILDKRLCAPGTPGQPRGPWPYGRWLRRQGWLGGWLGQGIDDILAGDGPPPKETFEEALQRWREGNKRQ